MPPHFPVESFQTKEWATATIDNLFADNRPVSFEPFKPINFHYEPVSSDINTINNNSAIRRSLSILETTDYNRQILNSHPHEVKPYSKSLQSENSTSTTSTSATVSSHGSTSSLYFSISSTSLLMSPPQLTRSISARIKRTLKPDRSQLSKRMLSFKEREGIEIWKRTFREYLSSTNKAIHSTHTQSALISQFILNELITTETTYLRHLIIIKEIFMDPLLEAATAYPRPLINLRDIQAIFAFIPELISLSSSLVDRLKGSTNTGECALGKVFSDLEDCFDIYIGYAANFSKQKRCISRADRSIVYRQLLQDSLRKKETNRMGLSEYMIAPIQRITRYGLLLKDLIKHHDHHHPDYIYIQRSLKCHLALAYAMNEIQGK